MAARRFSSAKVILSTSFLALASSAVAACGDPEPVNEDHVWYCTSDGVTIVDGDRCDEDGDGVGGMYWLYHSTTYPHNLRPGDRLPAGGSRIAYNDTGARTSWGLSPTGSVKTGSPVRVSVAGKGGTPIRGGGGS